MCWAAPNMRTPAPTRLQDLNNCNARTQRPKGERRRCDVASSRWNRQSGTALENRWIESESQSPTCALPGTTCPNNDEHSFSTPWRSCNGEGDKE